MPKLWRIQPTFPPSHWTVYVPVVNYLHWFQILSCLKNVPLCCLDLNHQWRPHTGVLSLGDPLNRHCVLSGSFLFCLNVISAQAAIFEKQRLSSPFPPLFSTGPTAVFACWRGRRICSLVRACPAFLQSFVEISNTFQILRKGTCFNKTAGQRSSL